MAQAQRINRQTPSFQSMKIGVWSIGIGLRGRIYCSCTTATLPKPTRKLKQSRFQRTVAFAGAFRASMIILGRVYNINLVQ